MDLGTAAGGPERLCQLLFIRGEVRTELARVRTYTDAISTQGLADVHLVAPFIRTVVGTDRYVDQLW